MEKNKKNQNLTFSFVFFFVETPETAQENMFIMWRKIQKHESNRGNSFIFQLNKFIIGTQFLTHTFLIGTKYLIAIWKINVLLFVNSRVKVHMKWHEVHPGFTCRICHNQLENKDLYKAHMEQHKLKGPLTCVHCDKVSIDVRSLRRHVLLHVCFLISFQFRFYFFRLTKPTFHHSKGWTRAFMRIVWQKIHYTNAFEFSSLVPSWRACGKVSILPESLQNETEFEPTCGNTRELNRLNTAEHTQIIAKIIAKIIEFLYFRHKPTDRLRAHFVIWNLSAKIIGSKCFYMSILCDFGLEFWEKSYWNLIFSLSFWILFLIKWQKIKSIFRFRVHEKRHTVNTKTEKCTFCSAAFEHKFHLRQHMKRRHEAEVPNGSIDDT